MKNSKGSGEWGGVGLMTILCYVLCVTKASWILLLGQGKQTINLVTGQTRLALARAAQRCS